eukprot:9498960-Pyramimonas_sp.AAC.1
MIDRAMLRYAVGCVDGSCWARCCSLSCSAMTGHCIRLCKMSCYAKICYTEKRRGMLYRSLKRSGPVPYDAMQCPLCERIRYVLLRYALFCLLAGC